MARKPRKPEENERVAEEPEDSVADSESEQEYRAALEQALRFLGHRPHAVRELRLKLRTRLTEETLERVVNRLLGLGYLDDSSFAREYAAQRFQRSPRAALAVVRELTARGVEEETAQRAVAIVMEEQGLEEQLLAAAAARKKIPSFKGLGIAEQKMKLFRFLSSRGFANAAALEAVARILKPARQ